MEDVPGGNEIWVNNELKFRLLADVSNYMLGIAEHDRGGFMFERGMIAGNKLYRKKTYILKREYPSEAQEHDNYSAMQSEGTFLEFERAGRLFTWRDTAELIEACGKAYVNW